MPTFTIQIPKTISQHIYSLFDYARLRVNKERFLTIFMLFNLTLSVVVAIASKLLFKVTFFGSFLAAIIILWLIFYFSLSLKADAIASFVESILPDVLQLMSSNLRAGLTADKAFLLSARPEFGILQDEINTIGKKIALGEDMGTVMQEMTTHFKSEKLKKTFSLIITGLRSGGQLTDLLDHTAHNLRQERLVEEKIRTNVLMYVIFIFAAIGIGAPVLFGLSSFLISVLEKNLATIQLPETTVLPITFAKSSISPSFTLIFSLISLLTTSILGSLVLGLISKGKEKYGVKFIPFLIILSLSIFFITRFLISSLLGGLFGFT